MTSSSNATPSGASSSGATQWQELSAQASLASHRLVGWIYWDPEAIARYSKLGIENGFGYYIATRCAPLASAGDEVVIAACYSIHADFIRLALKLARESTTFSDAYRVRNEAVELGLEEFVPEIVGDLGEMSGDLWQAAESLPISGRVLHAAHRGWPRCEDQPALSAWLAINCIREWRGDTHWAVLAAHDVNGVQAGLLHDAFLGYPGDWIPRSRGANDAQLNGHGIHLTSAALSLSKELTQKVYSSDNSLKISPISSANARGETSEKRKLASSATLFCHTVKLCFRELIKLLAKTGCPRPATLDENSFIF